MTIQKNIRLNGPEDFHNLELIRLEELRAIRRIWVLDKHEFDDSLPDIYEDVIGIPFNDPDWIHEENFGKEEWNVLYDVCNKAYGDEELAFEMMYRMIDIENQATGLNQRKGIIDSLESVIGQTFYRNEDDARDYYFQKMSRKKEMGGRYNEKFLDYMPNEPDEDAEDEAE